MSDLYVIIRSDAPVVKIGRSDSPTNRALDIQRTQCFWASVVATFPQQGYHETSVHEILKAHRVRGPGREWFSVSVEQAIKTIATILGQHTVLAEQPTPRKRTRKEQSVENPLVKYKA